MSCWYPVHLCGGSFDATGMAYVSFLRTARPLPLHNIIRSCIHGVSSEHNDTHNTVIAQQRSLPCRRSVSRRSCSAGTSSWPGASPTTSALSATSSARQANRPRHTLLVLPSKMMSACDALNPVAYPRCICGCASVLCPVNERGEFLHDGSWETPKTVQEIITVAGGPDIPLMVTFSRHGPIVDGVLPAAAGAMKPGGGPISLQWVAAHGEPQPGQCSSAWCCSCGGCSSAWCCCCSGAREGDCQA